MVAANYRTADVFKNYGIDFCCGGGISVKQACEEKGLEVDEVLAKLKVALAEEDKTTPDYKSWPLDKLADHIENTHHKYVAENIPVLLGYLERINTVHGEKHPELAEVLELFRESAGDLTAT